MKEVIANTSYLNPSQIKSTSHEKFDSTQSDNAYYPELFIGDSLLELCNSFWERSPGSSCDVQPFLRGCKWSPDGTCCLSIVNHDGFHVTELPRDLYDGCPTRERMITLMLPAIHVKEPGPVYDFCWYPNMNSHIPDTCTWITTKRNSPIQMWDAYNGSLRCTYRGYNSVDEVEHALSVIFSKHGEIIIGGYKNCLRTFNVERPGREFFEHKITSPASCMATNGELLAVGSWNRSIKLFSISEMGSGYKSVGNMYGHTGGVTHIQFTPDKTKLVSGGRKDHRLIVWDIRHYKTPLNILKRCVTTNQTIYFDISRCGRYLVSGGTDGVIRVWDDVHVHWTKKFNVEDDNEENATFRFPLHRDSCNSVSLHPSRPILATGSGQIHFVDPAKVLEEETSSDEENICQPPAASQFNLDESANKHLEMDSKNIVNTRTSTFDIKVEANLCSDSENESIEAQNSNLTDESIKVDPNHEGQDKLNLDHNFSPVLSEQDNTEEPPRKRIALDNVDKHSIAVPTNLTNGVKSNTTALIAVSTLEMNIDGFSTEEDKLNIGKSKSQVLNLSRLDDAKEGVSHSSTDTLLKEDALDKSHLYVQKLNTESAQMNNTSINCSMTTPDCNLSVDAVDKSPAALNVNTHTNLDKTPVEDNEFDKSPSLKVCNQIPTKQKPYSVDLKKSKQVLNNRNEMMYSSYTENYLTFWWIAEVSDAI